MLFSKADSFVPLINNNESAKMINMAGKLMYPGLLSQGP